MTWRVLIGDCIEQMRTLDAGSVHTCVTSPPYFGLRDYGQEGQIGLEDTPDAFVARLVDVFREVRRVLRDDGTLWLNLGDSYAGGGAIGRNDAGRDFTGGGGNKLGTGNPGLQGVRKPVSGLKHKDLIGIPWRVAFALQADGWYLRQDIIWHKPNPMPESVRDRCTKAHEYVFLLSKGPRYYFDADAIKEVSATGDDRRRYAGTAVGASSIRRNDLAVHAGRIGGGDHRNRRSVWTVTTKPFKGAHFATFPPDLIEPCILAGSPAQCCAQCGAPWERVVKREAMVIARSERTHEKGQTRSSGTMLSPAKSETLGFKPTCSCDAGTVGGTVLDPFGGSGTTAGVAVKHGRRAVLCELNPGYAAMMPDRVARIAGELFAGAAE